MTTDFTIFSLEPAYTREDIIGVAEDIDGKLLEGCYKGIKELSILVPTEVFITTLRAKVIDSAQQESVLHLKKTSKQGQYLAYLEYFAEDKVEYVGMLEEVTKKEALNMEAYSYDPSQDKYFAINEVQNGSRTI
jgi:hypothetical protein